jgi:hypothetical protein
MKNLISPVCLLYLAMLGLSDLLAADPPPPKTVEKVLMQDNRTWSADGNSLVANDSDVRVAGIVLVKTNGIFTVNQGKDRQLQEGQVIQSDGSLISPDGTIAPVLDHVIMKSGKPVLVKDGASSPVGQPLSLENGSVVLPDGYFTVPGGRKTRLLDGQLITLDGKFLPVKDSVTMQKGKVIVQKDGSSIPVGANSSITMNDGTRVYGDGRLVKMDGTTSRVAEGQIILVEGVVQRN